MALEPFLPVLPDWIKKLGSGVYPCWMWGTFPPGFGTTSWGTQTLWRASGKPTRFPLIPSSLPTSQKTVALGRANCIFH